MAFISHGESPSDRRCSKEVERSCPAGHANHREAHKPNREQTEPLQQWPRGQEWSSDAEGEAAQYQRHRERLEPRTAVNAPRIESVGDE